MSKSYTPGLKVLKNTKIIKQRQLPMKGEVHMEIGDLVNPNSIVASTKIPGNVHMVNISNELNVEPNAILEYMLINIDDNVKKGQIIAETKGFFGFFKGEVISPVDGILANISDITGQALISENPIPIEIDAYTKGKIIRTINDEGVIVEADGAMIQGILGIGGERRGKLMVIAESPSCVLTENDLEDIHEKKIIVCGSYVGYNFIKRAVDIGVSGIICGGFDYDNLSRILSFELGVAITGSEDIGLSLIITEGFGQIAMAKRTFDLLKFFEEYEVSINGATQIRAGVIRPEVIITHNEKFKEHDTNSEDELAITEGSIVRAIRQPYFGMVGKVIDLPSELTALESGTFARVAKVEFDDKKYKIIPRTNLELIIG